VRPTTKDAPDSLLSDFIVKCVDAGVAVELVHITIKSKVTQVVASLKMIGVVKHSSRKVSTKRRSAYSEIGTRDFKRTRCRFNVSQ